MVDQAAETYRRGMDTTETALLSTLKERVERYERDGYLIVPDALRGDEVQTLRHEALRICRGELGPVDGLVPAAPDEPDDVVIRRYICIHFPHKLSALMRRALA